MCAQTRSGLKAHHTTPSLSSSFLYSLSPSHISLSPPPSLSSSYKGLKTSTHSHMAEKISTVVLKVDLECDRCYKKIRKVLCKIQDKANIKTISYDEKGNTVTISGPFDPDKVCKKLCYEAGKVISEMRVQGKPDKDAAKTKDPKSAEKEGKPDKDKAAPQPGKEKKDAAKPEKKVKFEDVANPEKAEKMTVARLVPEPPRGEPVAMMMPPAQGVAVPSIWPAPAPANEGAYYGWGTGCRCGRVAAPPPAAGGYYGYGLPVYEGNQGWCQCYGRPPYYYQQQQPPCYEDPDAGCNIM